MDKYLALLTAVLLSGCAVSPKADPVAQQQSDLALLTIAPGIELRQLVGPEAPIEARTERGSITRFRLAPGAASPWSYSRQSEEVFMVVRGSGSVWIGERAQSVSPGSYILVPPGMVRSVQAGTREPLEFYAITMPAWHPDSDVLVADPRVQP